MTKSKAGSLREKLLSARDLVVEPVQLPIMDEPVYIREMTAGLREEFEAYASKYGNTAEPAPQFREELLIRTVSDADGELLFTREDIAELQKKSSRTVVTLFDIAMRVNKLRKEDVEASEKQ